MNTTKSDICRRVSNRLGNQYKISHIKTILETSFDEILSILAEEKRIEIRGFGAFKTKMRQPKIGRNPRTGEVVPVPAYKTPSFKFSKDAQKIFNEKIQAQPEKQQLQPVSEPSENLKSIENFSPV